MRKARWALPLLAACLTVPAGAGAAGAVSSGATWGKPAELPGLAALNVGDDARVETLSCASVGNCALGGNYVDGSDHTLPYVASKAKGTWGDAEEVPGIAALDPDGYASVSSVSCASAGNCSAGGSYTDSSHNSQAFVVDETDGTWGNAAEILGTAGLKATSASIQSVSCASAGNCSAAGTYMTLTSPSQVFVISETNGLWGTAEEMPGLSVLNTGKSAEVSQVSCGSVGNCAVGGAYTTAKSKDQAFIENEIDGVWGKARLVPGTGALNTGGNADLESVSCVPAGDCSAVGTYDSGSSGQAFIADETNGTWAAAREVPGLAALNVGGGAQLESVSCASAANCSAVGHYTDSAQNYQAFAVSETNGTWGTAAEIPGTAKLNTASAAGQVVSCGSPGDCTAAGVYSFSRAGFGGQGFVVTETNGNWGNAEPVPGLQKLNPGGQSGVGALSCRSAGHCTASGGYGSGSADEVFVISEY